MSLKPRNTIDDHYIDDLVCAICGQPNLRVAHLDKFPDFVSCTNCEAAFVLEDTGDWIMYGKIPPEYPETSKFALKQWTWHDAVRQRAEDEREGVVIAAPPASEPEPPVEVPVAVNEGQTAPAMEPPAPLDERTEDELVPPLVDHDTTDDSTVEDMRVGEPLGFDQPAAQDMTASEVETATPLDEMAHEVDRSSPFDEAAHEVEQPSSAESEAAFKTFPPPPIFGEPEPDELGEGEGEHDLFATEEIAAGEMVDELAMSEKVVEDAEIGDEAVEDQMPAESPLEGEPLSESVSPFVSQSGADLFDTGEDPAFLTDVGTPASEEEVEFLAEPAADAAEEEPLVSPFIDRLEKELKASGDSPVTADSSVAADSSMDEPLVMEESTAPADASPALGSPITEPPVEKLAPADEREAAKTPMPEPITETPEMEPELEYGTPEGEPEQGFRYRVVVKGSQLKFPKNVCAHDLQRPVSLGATVRGTLPDPNNPGERNPLAFSLPLCKDCKRRADARSDEEKSALLQAHLISGIVAVFLVVIALVAGFVNVVEDPLISIFILLLLGVLGYGLPAIFLLSRANRFPPPYDAAYVLSTLLVVDDAGDLQTSFEWRNEGYAELFRQVNRHNVIGETARLPDKLTLMEPQHPTEMAEEGSEDAHADLREAESELPEG